MTTTPFDDHARYNARGCGELFATVIQQAFHDAFAPASSYTQKELVRSEAISFLTSGAGEWAAHRRFLCDLIGIDSDVLRRYVHEILMGERDPTLAIPGVERACVEQFKQAQVDAARVVYQRQFQRPKSAKPNPIKAKATGAMPPPVTPMPEPARSAVMDDWFANLTADA
jgi:hypothetical protein